MDIFILEKRLNRIEDYLLQKIFYLIDRLSQKDIINERQNFRIKYFAKHWKLGTYLILGTYKFGINNQWWSNFKGGIFSLPWHKRIWNIVTICPLFWRYKAMKFRMRIGFVSGETYKKLFDNKKYE